MKPRRQGKSRLIENHELRRILKIQKDNPKHGLRNSCLVVMSLYLGLRVSELANLRIGDVVTEDGQIKGSVDLKKENTKGNKSRPIYLVHPEVIQVLRKYLDQRKERERNLNPDRPLFKSQKGDGFSPRSLQRLFKLIYMDAGLDDMVSSHSGRRTFATNLIESGIDLKTVSFLMGHASIKTTVDVYVEPNPKKMENVSRNLQIR
ncbi:tyrosine-type recombinase/integrase [Nitrospina gracilis]|uniref:tyrosine-type recombinase/integrase n=1 Tax=Nitrospina gracilis TaxID=35801 RepID=UPI001F2D8B4E|nr:site-specific integrase [Nitrospina gracilis]MCF8719813.1 integrase/recombinase XerD [Nitrospina gracilis Nb-211]